MNLKFKKFNTYYAPDPDLADPVPRVDGDRVVLNFQLNHYLYKQFERDAWGKITFNDCLMYRVGSPNDEGFFINPKNPDRYNDSRWNYTDFPELEFSNFYIVENSDWRQNFGPDSIINKEIQSKITDLENLNHYLLFMKEGTFECIARNYVEEIPLKAKKKNRFLFFQ